MPFGLRKSKRFERVAALELPPGQWERAWTSLSRRDVLGRIALALGAAAAICVLLRGWDPPDPRLVYRTGYTPERDIVATVAFVKADEAATDAGPRAGPRPNPLRLRAGLPAAGATPGPVAEHVGRVGCRADAGEAGPEGLATIPVAARRRGARPPGPRRQQRGLPQVPRGVYAPRVLGPGREGAGRSPRPVPRPRPVGQARRRAQTRGPGRDGESRGDIDVRSRAPRAEGSDPRERRADRRRHGDPGCAAERFPAGPGGRPVVRLAPGAAETDSQLGRRGDQTGDRKGRQVRQTGAGALLGRGRVGQRGPAAGLSATRSAAAGV